MLSLPLVGHAQLFQTVPGFVLKKGYGSSSGLTSLPWYHQLWVQSASFPLFSWVNRVCETASPLTCLVISWPCLFGIPCIATVVFCLGLFLHCEHKHLFDVPDIKYTVHSRSVQRMWDSCFWKLHWQKWQKAVWTPDTKDGTEDDGTHLGWVRPSLLPNNMEQRSALAMLCICVTAGMACEPEKKSIQSPRGGLPLLWTSSLHWIGGSPCRKTGSLCIQASTS